MKGYAPELAAWALATISLNDSFARTKQEIHGKGSWRQSSRIGRLGTDNEVELGRERYWSQSEYKARDKHDCSSVPGGQ